MPKLKCEDCGAGEARRIGSFILCEPCRQRMEINIEWMEEYFDAKPCNASHEFGGGV